MSRNRILKRMGEVILLTLPILLLLSIFYPVFARWDRRAPCQILDANRQPLPGVTLHFRDSSGAVRATVTSDKQGEFRQRDMKHLTLSPADGYGLAIEYFNSKGPSHYVFSPLVQQTATITDQSGTTLSSVPLFVVVNQRTYRTISRRSVFSRISDNKGEIVIGTYLPGAARFAFASDDTRYYVAATQTTVTNGQVHYKVTLGSAGTLTGRLLDASGKPFRDYSRYHAFVTDDPTGQEQPFNYEGMYEYGPTDNKGQFQIHRLPPGRHYVGVRTSDDTLIGSVQSVTIPPSGTARVELRASH